MVILLEFGGDASAVDRERETPLHKATRAGHRTTMNLLLRSGADADASNCWGEMAGTLAPAYKMNPEPSIDDRKVQGGGKGEDGSSDACVACSAKRGRHYYFCKSEFLQETPDSLVLGPDGLPIVDDVG